MYFQTWKRGTEGRNRGNANHAGRSGSGPSAGCPGHRGHGFRKSHALEYMAIRAGFLNDIVFIRDLHEQFSIRCSVLRRLCRRLTGLGVEGNVAELGCYRGDTSWQLNVLMPDRKLYLFDTFEGFDERDVDMERKLGCSDAQTGLYSGTDKEKLMERMPLPGQVVIRKGWFPETAFDIEDETFCLVCMDACLYQPTLAGLEFSFPAWEEEASSS